MARGDVHMTMTADEADAWAAVQKVTGGFKGMERAAGSATRKSRRGFRRMGRDVRRFAMEVAGVGSAAGAIYLVAQQLRREYDLLVRRQAEAARTQMSVGDLRAAALLNRPAEMDVGFLDALVERVSRRQQITQERLWPVLSSMLSAKGSVSDEQFAAVLREVGRLGARGGPMVDLQTFAGAGLDLAKLNPKASPAELLGWLRQIGTSARVVNPEKQARAIPRVLSAAAPAGVSQEEAAELWATITQLSGDVQGRRSATGTINLLQRLMKGQVEGMLPEKVLGQVRLRKLSRSGMAGFREIQEWYQQAPEDLREQFLAGFQAEAPVKGALQQLFMSAPEAMSVWKTARGQIGTPGGETATVWQDYFRSVAAGRTEPTRSTDRAFSSAIEAIQLANDEGVGGITREKLEELVKALPGQSDFENRLLRASFEMGSDFGRDPVGAVHRVRSMIEKKMGRDLAQRNDPLNESFVAPPNSESLEDLLHIELRPTGRSRSAPYSRPIDPEMQAPLARLAEQLGEIVEELRAQEARPQKVEIVGGAPNPDVHREN